MDKLIPPITCKTSSKQAAVQHVSGHAAAWLAHGGKVRRMSITERGDCFCDGKYIILLSDPLWEGRSTSEALQIYIAGPLVEWGLERNGLDIDKWEQDGIRIRELLKRRSGGILDTWVRKTKNLLSNRKSRIEALAQALFDRGSLDGDEPKKIWDSHR